MGGKSDTPPVPPYQQLAQEQSQDSSQLLQQQTTANRPDTTTPYGSTAWNFNPGTQTWSGSETLNPTLQSTLQTQEDTGLGQAVTQSTQAGAAGNLLNTDLNNGTFGPLNYSGVPQVGTGSYYNPEAQNAVWNEFQTMQQPLQAQQTESQQSQLEAQGLRPGDQAYNTAMNNLSNTQYQQQQSAEDQAVLAGEQEAQTMQGMDVTAQNADMNMINSNAFGNLNLYNGLMGQPQGVNGPTSVPTASSGMAQTPDILGAAEQMYGSELNSTNASNAANGNLFSGLMGLGGAALGAYGMSSLGSDAAIAAMMM